MRLGIFDDMYALETSRIRVGSTSLLPFRENTTLRDLTGFMVTDNLSAHIAILFKSELGPRADTERSSTIPSGGVSSA